MTGPAPRPEGWPDPNDRPCDDCGHVWFAGERQHEYAAGGAGAERPEDAEVICVLCRVQRGPGAT